MTGFKKWRTVTFAAIIISFLLPFASVSCPGMPKVNITGLDLVKGSTMTMPSQTGGQPESRQMDPEPFALGAAACAVLGLLLSLVVAGKVRTPFTILGGAGAVLLLLVKNKLQGDLESQMGGETMGGLGGMGSLLNWEPAFWFALLAFAGIAVASLVLKGGGASTVAQAPPQAPPASPPT